MQPSTEEAAPQPPQEDVERAIEAANQQLNENLSVPSPPPSYRRMAATTQVSHAPPSPPPPALKVRESRWRSCLPDKKTRAIVVCVLKFAVLGLCIGVEVWFLVLAIEEREPYLRGLRWGHFLLQFVICCLWYWVCLRCLFRTIEVMGTEDE